MKEGERGPFFPFRVRIKDNNSSPHGKFYRFLFPFSSKFSDLNFASYVLYIYLHTVSLGYLCFNLNLLVSAYRVASYAELYSSGRVRGAFVGTIYTDVANF